MIVNLKGDILGGVVSAFVALPLTLACGVLLFKGIPGFESLGINAAIFSAIIASLVTAFIGSHSLQISGPRVVTTLILWDFLYSFFQNNQNLFVNSLDYTYIFISLIMAIVVISGLFQILFSLLRLGKLIKFLPISVTMGISTTIGLIIISKQIPILFNYHGDNFFSTLFLNPLEIFEGTQTLLLLSISIFTIILLFSKDYISLLTSKINLNLGTIIPLLAPLIGVALFLATPLDSSDFFLNKVNIAFPDFRSIFMQKEQILLLFQDNIFKILSTSFSIALISSLSSLVSVSILESRISCRNKSTSIELLGQGLGNIASGFLGGTVSSGSEARGLSNYNAGGRTYLSAIIHSLTLIAVVSIFSGYLTYIPVVILSSLLIYTALTMISPLYALLKRGMCVCLNKEYKQIKECIKDTGYTLLIVIVMLLTAYIEDVSKAIIYGFATASIIFIIEMMKSSIFKVISADIHHSRKIRHEEAMMALKKEGRVIKIIELEGAIFFGTADSLRKTIENLDKDVNWVILDFRNVSEMDITGAEIIKLCIKENPNIGFSLSSIIEGDDSYQALCSVGLIGESELLWYSNADSALEHAEDEFLKSKNISPMLDSHKLSLHELSITKSLKNEYLDYLSKLVIEKDYKKGEYLFKESQPANELFLLRKGLVSIKTKEKKFEYDNKHSIDDRHEILYSSRRITFSAGVVFGEMAFFENNLHSVEAIAEDDVSVFIISRETFDYMGREHPVLVQQLLMEFCRHLSERLREVTKEVHILEN